MARDANGKQSYESESSLGPNSMTVLRTIGDNQFRVRELCIETRKYGLSAVDTQFALGDLCERGLAKTSSNGFDCLYILTRAGRELLGERRPSSLLREE